MKKIILSMLMLGMISQTLTAAELGAGGGSGYPAAIDTDTSPEIDFVTVARDDVPNDMADAIIKIQTELGINPAGGAGLAFLMYASTIQARSTDGIYIIDVSTNLFLYLQHGGNIGVGTTDLNGRFTVRAIAGNSIYAYNATDTAFNADGGTGTGIKGYGDTRGGYFYSYDGSAIVGENTDMVTGWAGKFLGRVYISSGIYGAFTSTTVTINEVNIVILVSSQTILNLQMANVISSQTINNNDITVLKGSVTINTDGLAVVVSSFTDIHDNYARKDSSPTWMGYHIFENFLQTKKYISLSPSLVTSTIISASISGMSSASFRVYCNGKIEWGTGYVGTDTNLYRSAANMLKTDDSFSVGANFYVTGYSSTTGNSYVIGDSYTTGLSSANEHYGGGGNLTGIDAVKLGGIEAATYLSTGVVQIVAGTNITIAPPDGRGIVTVTAAGGNGNGVAVVNISKNMYIPTTPFVTDYIAKTSFGNYAVTIGSITVYCDSCPLGSKTQFNIRITTPSTDFTEWGVPWSILSGTDTLYVAANSSGTIITGAAITDSTIPAGARLILDVGLTGEVSGGAGYVINMAGTTD